MQIIRAYTLIRLYFASNLLHLVVAFALEFGRTEDAAQPGGDVILGTSVWNYDVKI